MVLDPEENDLGMEDSLLRNSALALVTLSCRARIEARSERDSSTVGKGDQAQVRCAKAEVSSVSTAQPRLYPYESARAGAARMWGRDAGDAFRPRRVAAGGEPPGAHSRAAPGGTYGTMHEMPSSSGSPECLTSAIILAHGSRHQPFEAVLVVQATENRPCHDPLVPR